MGGLLFYPHWQWFPPATNGWTPGPRHVWRHSTHDAMREVSRRPNDLKGVVLMVVAIANRINGEKEKWAHGRHTMILSIHFRFCCHMLQSISHKLLHFEWSPPWHLYIFLLANLLAFYLAYLLAFYLAVEVRQCPLGSGARGWGPAVPTAIWKSRLRSGSAHCDLEVVVEVRQCPLRSGSRGWGPAVPTATWKSRLRSGSAHWDLELAVEVRQCPLGSGARGGGPAVPTGI